jgi:hypothetical protein
MDLSLFKPNLKNVLIGILFFLASSFIIWLPFLKNGSLSLLQIIIAIVELIVCYVLSSIWVHNFNFNDLKKMPLARKMIILVLLFNFASILILMFNSLMRSVGVTNLVTRAMLSYSSFPPLFITLLIASLVFLSINIRSNWIFSSLFFLYPFFDFSRSVYNPGLLNGRVFSIIQSLAAGDFITFWLMFLSSLFDIAIIFYLFTAVRQGHKSEKLERTMLIILIATYLIIKLNIIRIVMIQVSFGNIFDDILNIIIFFAILLGFHYYSKKSGAKK